MYIFSVDTQSQHCTPEKSSLKRSSIMPNNHGKRLFTSSPKGFSPGAPSKAVGKSNSYIHFFIRELPWNYYRLILASFLN